MAASSSRTAGTYSLAQVSNSQGNSPPQSFRGSRSPGPCAEPTGEGSNNFIISPGSIVFSDNGEQVSSSTWAWLWGERPLELFNLPSGGPGERSRAPTSPVRRPEPRRNGK
ncbi:hypothetical protein ACJZ2D_015572 [Fusarium nematophilum]